MGGDDREVGVVCVAQGINSSHCTILAERRVNKAPNPWTLKNSQDCPVRVLSVNLPGNFLIIALKITLRS